MTETNEESLSALLHETRTFPPPEELSREANAQPGIYAEAESDPLAFWEEQARRLDWTEPWSEVLQWDLPFAGGSSAAGSTSPSTASIAMSRPAGAIGSPSTGRASRGTPAPSRTATCWPRSCQAANALTELGVRTGDRVAIYMPMIPEAVVAMLACTRIGRAPHRRLRRLLVRCPCAAGSSTAMRDTSSRPTADTAAARRARSKPRSTRPWPECPGRREGPRGAPHRSGRRLERRPGRLVARGGRHATGGARGRVVRRRAPALHPVHQRHDRQAEGHHPHAPAAT